MNSLELHPPVTGGLLTRAGGGGTGAASCRRPAPLAAGGLRRGPARVAAGWSWAGVPGGSGGSFLAGRAAGRRGGGAASSCIAASSSQVPHDDIRRPADRSPRTGSPPRPGPARRGHHRSTAVSHLGQQRTRRDRLRSGAVAVEPGQVPLPGRQADVQALRRLFRRRARPSRRRAAARRTRRRRPLPAGPDAGSGAVLRSVPGGGRRLRGRRAPGRRARGRGTVLRA